VAVHFHFLHVPHSLSWITYMNKMLRHIAEKRGWRKSSDFRAVASQKNLVIHNKICYDKWIKSKRLYEVLLLFPSYNPLISVDPLGGHTQQKLV
jgi:hypothetical protein